MSDAKAVIKSADMSEEMQQEAVECSTQALEKYNIEKDIASHIKREFDRKYGKFFIYIYISLEDNTLKIAKKGPTWHCVVGRNFGSFVTHGKDIYTYIKKRQV